MEVRGGETEQQKIEASERYTIRVLVITTEVGKVEDERPCLLKVGRYFNLDESMERKSTSRDETEGRSVHSYQLRLQLDRFRASLMD